MMRNTPQWVPEKRTRLPTWFVLGKLQVAHTHTLDVPLRDTSLDKLMAKRQSFDCTTREEDVAESPV